MKKEKYIYERNGSYVVIIKWTQDKKQLQKQIGSFPFTKYGSKTAALKAAKKARDQAFVNIELERISDQIYTVDRLFEESQRLLTHNIKTRERHDTTYRALVPESLRIKRIELVTAADIQQTINTYAETHSPDAMPRALTIWRTIYKTAAMHELPVADKSQAVTLPKSQVPIKRREKFVSHEDLEIFLDALLTYGYGPVNEHRNTDLYMMIRIMMYSGIRPQEVLALTVDDINLAAGTLLVNKSIGSTTELKRQVITTKTPESVRVMPIPDELTQLLQDFIKDKDGMLFLDVDRKPYEITAVADYLHRVSVKAGVKVTLYMLRHMFATDMAKVTDPRTLQTLMGHASATMSLGYANRSSLAELADALKKRKLS